MNLPVGVIYAITCTLCDLVHCQHQRARPALFARGVCRIPARGVATVPTRPAAHPVRPGRGRPRLRTRFGRP
jgi:hypothetical protein